VTTATTERKTLVPGVFRKSLPRRRTRRVFSRRQRIVFGVLNLTAFFVIWQLIATFADVPRLYLPPVTAVFGELVEMSREGILWSNLTISLVVYLIGMAISIVISVPCGLLIGGIPLLDKALGTYIWALYTMPRIVLMPLILLWVGINDASRVTIIVLSAVPATLVVIMEGVKTVDNSLLTAARSFGASRFQLFKSVVMPATVPFIATGVRMGVSRGLLGLFIGELFTSTNGIGYIITLAQKTFNTSRVYAMLLVFLLFCVAMVGFTSFIERKVMEWRRPPD
jgi:ABC-type nitrate/sulfonate/bicarbonate transport system permease component